MGKLIVSLLLILCVLGGEIWLVYDYVHMRADVHALKEAVSSTEDMVTAAIRAREQLHEQAKQHAQEADALITEHCAWADTDVPADIREWLCKKN